MAAARLAVLRAFWSPRNVIPRLIVKDIRDIDFISLRNQGYNSIVIDKDNCLTIPHKDTVVPLVQSSLELCKATFTPERVLIVSNSSGTPSEDPGFIEAESVQRQLGCPVLRHVYKKPSKRCAREILNHFASLPAPNPTQLDSGNSATVTIPSLAEPKLVVIGDRLMTDILLANEMSAYGIWTTSLWQREALILRFIERSYLFLVTRWFGFIAASRERRLRLIEAEEEKKATPEEEPGRKTGVEVGNNLSS